MKKNLCYFLFFLFVILHVQTVYADELSTTVSIFENTYLGTYSGTINANTPDGTGTFVSDFDEDGFSLTGTWNNGILSGKTTISYNDGRKLIVKYNNGLISGNITDYNADGSYRIYSCTKGRPYGLITEYSSDDSVSGYDYFYQMQSINTLKAQSTTADYNTLISTSQSSGPLKISGTVIHIYETEKKQYIVFEDENTHIYILTYGNIYTNKYNQAIVPNLIEGDNITAYGFLLKQASLNSIDGLTASIRVSEWQEQNNLSDYYSRYISVSSTDDINNSDNDTSADFITLIPDYANTLPFIQLFFAEAENEQITFNSSALSYEYDDLLRNPYLYDNQKLNITAKVIKADINYSSNRSYMILEDIETGNAYYMRYDFPDSSLIPASNNIIEVSGSYDGITKELLPLYSYTNSENLAYVIFPRIYSNDITILQ